MESTKTLHTQQTFGQRLRFVREQKGFSMQEFATAIGYDKSYISRLESGKNTNPSLEFIEFICDGFGVSRTWLQSGEGTPFVASEQRGSGFQEETRRNFACVEIVRFLMNELPPNQRLNVCKKLTDSQEFMDHQKLFWVPVFYEALMDKAQLESGLHPDRLQAELIAVKLKPEKKGKSGKQA